MKTDNISPEVQAKESFFKFSDDVNPPIKSFALEIERQSKRRNFLDYFIRFNGQPLWDKGIVQQYSGGIYGVNSSDIG
ncbi:hypothetical protein LX66_3904 [Chitinophaga japonensis]|uniref:Uncharacterized protein n=2 Tax=Chitinophaga japonensis TaxID=104662 RepID=A0A562SZF9_CHIJA|nr:hypothetical protein LX66_3904 [Chitinophaga japonensis]